MQLGRPSIVFNPGIGPLTSIPDDATIYRTSADPVSLLGAGRAHVVPQTTWEPHGLGNFI